MAPNGPTEDGLTDDGPTEDGLTDDGPTEGGLTEDFAAAMAELGPFGHAPRVAVAVSGGADSMALAILADAWARARGGQVRGLVVDHGLRAASAAEAAATVAALRALGMAAERLDIADLQRGAGLAERARDARYRVLTDACQRHAIVHLLLGHHAADQAETLSMRVLGGSGGRGLAGMAALTEARTLRLLRPLLRVPPGRLRRFLHDRGLRWVDDPSNRSPDAQRSRLRLLRGDCDRAAAGTRALSAAAAAAGRRRAVQDGALAAILAARAVLRPEGFAHLTPGPIAPEALAALLRTIAGAAHAPGLDRIGDLAARLRPTTIWGVRVLPAGKLGAGWLLVREEAALPPPVPLTDGAVWDGRFRAFLPAPPPLDIVFGALGRAAAGLRDRSDLPAAVLRSMPALWCRNVLVAVPQLHYRDPKAGEWGGRVVFEPPVPLTSAPFLPI